jgi:arsenate reductase
MAHGLGNHYQSNKFNFFSAGTKKHGMNPYAIKVMAEIGIDISSHESKTTDELPSESRMDFVFTVCSDAHENCPIFPEGKIIHFGFDDPPRLVKDLVGEKEILDVYRRVRDEIKNFIQNIDEHLG